MYISELSYPGGAQCRVAASPHQEDSAEVARASASHAFLTPRQGVLCMLHWKGAPVKILDMLEGLFLSTDLEMGFQRMSWSRLLGPGKSVHFF